MLNDHRKVAFNQFLLLTAIIKMIAVKVKFDNPLCFQLWQFKRKISGLKYKRFGRVIYGFL